MKQLRTLILLSVLGAVALSACGGDPIEVLPGSGDLEVAGQAIFNGTAANEPQHGAVVSLHQLVSSQVYVAPFCSGTLIRGDVVLTAAHCLDAGKRKPKPMAPTALAVYVGDRPADDILEHLYIVKELAIHPDYNSRLNVNDIALIRLSTPVSEPVQPVPALPPALGFTDADIGATLNFAGFGRTETGESGVKLQVDLPLAGVGCVVEGCPDGGDTSSHISYVQTGANGGPCSGDSGGPAFLFRDGSPYVAGVTSYGDAYCTIYGVSTRTDTFDSFINEFIGVTPPPPDCSADGVCNPECEIDPDCGVEPPPDCSADGVCNPECEIDPDCGVEPPPEGRGDGVCGAGESCDGRDGTVACEADCAGRHTGKPSGRYCYVEGVCVGEGCR